jgi:hypothetical protein
MRLAGWAAVACVFVLGAGGCGADEAARSVKEKVDPVARAAERTSASGGARIDGTMAMRFQGIRIPMTIDGVDVTDKVVDTVGG